MAQSITVCGSGAEVTVRFSPPIDLGNVPHELALVDLQTVNTVLNVRNGCNGLVYKDNKNTYFLSVPEGTYNVDGIHHHIYNILSKQFPEDFKNQIHYFELKADTSTHRCKISTSFDLTFGTTDELENPKEGRCHTLGTLLGFKSNTIKRTNRNEYAIADGTFSLLDDFKVFVTCNVITSGYVNDRISHNIYQFHIDVQPGIIVEEKAAHPVFYRVTQQKIDDITLRLENEQRRLIALKEGTKVCFNLILRERNT